MQRNWLLLVGLVLAVLATGCRRESASTRDELAGVIETDDGKSYIPIRVPERKSDTLLGAVAAGAEQPKEEEGAATEEPQVDDSSAEALGNSIVQMAKANDWQRLPDLLVAEQAEAVRGMIDGLGPFLVATGKFRQAAAGKFDAHAIVIPLQDAWLQQLASLANELTVEVPEPGEEEARLEFTLGPADAAEPQKLEMTARKVEDRWKLSLTDFQAPSDPAALALDKKAQDLEDLTIRVQDNNVADADAAKIELEKVATGTYEPAAAAPADNQGGEQAEAPAQPPNDRQSADMVDGAYTGPGQLRAR